MPGNHPESFHDAATWVDERANGAWLYFHGNLWSYGGDYTRIASAVAGPDTTICAGESVTIGLDPAPGLAYAWAGAEARTSRITVRPIATTRYVLNIVDTTNMTFALDTVTITVVPGASAYFTWTIGPLGAAFSAPLAGANGWRWEFGDGGTSSEQNPRHRYAAIGTYDVRLIASGPCGDDTLVRRVLVDRISSVRAEISSDVSIAA